MAYHMVQDVATPVHGITFLISFCDKLLSQCGRDVLVRRCHRISKCILAHFLASQLQLYSWLSNRSVAKSPFVLRNFDVANCVWGLQNGKNFFLLLEFGVDVDVCN